MAKTTEQLVEEMLDREAIRDLPARYCHYVWTNDVDGMLGIFTEDGVLSTETETGEVRETRGTEALRRFYLGLDGFKPRPYIHNHVVDLQGGGHATGVCYVELRSATQDMGWIGTGFYRDDYVKDGGAWRFRARRFHPVKMLQRL